MTDTNNVGVPAPTEVNPKLTHLAERLCGKWRVTGPDIDGEAEYKSLRDGRLLVGSVKVVVNGAEMTNIQHISHDQATDALRACYLDTMGNGATYTWLLDGQKIRVSQDDDKSDTYFEARFNDDSFEYAGTWHYPKGVGDGGAEERIVYTRVA
jgi:hypothetical protein